MFSTTSQNRLKIYLNARPFSLLVQAAIAVSLASFCIETLPDLSPSTRRTLHLIEAVTISLFTIEYILRIVAEGRRYVLSFFGVIDLLAIAPFFLSTGLDLRSLRAFRFLRIFQLLKLSRYSRAVRRLHIALIVAREELVLFGFIAIILMFLSSVGIYYFENEAQPEVFKSVFHSLWWAVCTLTTVGYGDIYPVTVGGKVFTFAVLIVGLGIVAAPAGLIASALSEARKIESEEHSAEVK